MEMEKMKERKYICLSVVFCMFVVVGCYKLTNASLWFDETIEYFYSKYPFGTIPGGGNMTGLYERIISTFQPPLYNVFMFYWLLVSDSEWWFRFSGVVLGLIGAIGFYKSIEKMIHFKAALIGVIVYTFIYRQMYYVQECAEYILMLAMLYWAFYFFILIMEKVTLKNTILFALFCSLAVYSQYGAVFPVFVLTCFFLIKVLSNKNVKEIKQTLIIYVTTLLVAVLPLYYFFLRLQMKGQGTVDRNSISVIFEKDNILYDFVNAIYNVFVWNMVASIGESGKYAVIIILIIFMIIGAIVLLKVKNTLSKYLVMMNVIAWVLYYISVKLGYYGYGQFSNRYHLFFIPIWLISIFCINYEFFGWLFIKLQLHNKEVFISIIKGALFVIIACYCINGWNAIKNNWTKEDIRGAVDIWYKEEAFNSATFVYYAAETGFAYYLEQNELYEEDHKNNVIYQSWMRNKTKEEYQDYFLNLYENEWPQEVYICGSHITKELDINTMIAVFTDRNYQMEILFDKNNAKLVRLKSN